MKDHYTDTMQAFTVFRQLRVGAIEILNKKVSATYELTTMKGEKLSNKLTYLYAESVFEPDDPATQNLASMMVAQVAVNYGLFCEKIVFDGLYGNTDRRYLLDMMENTSREIYVNRLLAPNEFLLEKYQAMEPVVSKRYTLARVEFVNTSFKGSKVSWNHWDVNRDRTAILSSGGKDSLLAYGITREMGLEAHPVFINESGRHWFTALNAFRYFEKHDKNTVRVWCNSDRLFNWMLRQMPFIRKNFSRIRSDMYPIRLWTVAVFLFGVLPVARKRGIGQILIGDEYDTTQRSVFDGIAHYNGLYDQSKFFDLYLTRYYLKKGWLVHQFSILRSLSEMLIQKILAERYPELQAQQVSCHASSEKDGRIYPCGKCEKCRRIVGMLKVLGKDPRNCGYDDNKIKQSLKSYTSRSVKQLGTDMQHLFYLLLEKELIERNAYTTKNAKERSHIMKLRFDHFRSILSDIPLFFRKPALKIFLEHTDGAMMLQNKKWVDFDVLNSREIAAPYPFDVKSSFTMNRKSHDPYQKNFLWEHLSWPELQERLQEVDTALLPCGAIEQHGPHLPVDIDYFDANYLARKVAEACSNPRPLVMPPIPYGVSYHHEDFKGTISVTNEALSRFVYDIGMSLAVNGIRKLIIINGHGDNAPTLNFAAQMINRDAGIFVCVDTGETSDRDIDNLSETHNDIHAGEVETSTSLALRPELVNMDKAERESPRFISSYMDYSSSRGVPWYVRTRKLSETGIIGDPTKASAEKGKKMWEVMIAHLVKFVEEIKSSKLDDLYQKKY